MEGDSQESTQFTETEPIETDSGFSESQSQTQSQPDHWGRLYPLKSSLSAIDLITNRVTFGWKNTDVVIIKEHLPSEVASKFSKLHFEICRQQIDVMGAPTTQVILFNRSSNGICINNHVIKSKKVLYTNDVVGLRSGKQTPSYEVYVYIEPLSCLSSTIPPSIRKKYQVSFRLGVGSFGEVSLVFDKVKKRPRAMKTIVKDLFANGQMLNSCKKKLLNEINILLTLDHPNVVKLVDTLDCEKEHALILEYMEGKDLCHRIEQSGRLNEAITKMYIYQISKGVEYLHSLSIVHRDLKPANILLASCDKISLVKLTDFGLSKVLSSETMMKTLCGTKVYVAPEVLLGGGSYEYNEQVDIWSLGVIFYVCLAGIEPFASEPDQVEDLIKEAIFCCMPSSPWNSVSDGAKNLINRMLTKDPNERITVAEILDDQWLQADVEMLKKVNTLYQSSFDVDETLTKTLSISQDLRDTQMESYNFCDPSSSPPQKKLRFK